MNEVKKLDYIFFKIFQNLGFGQFGSKIRLFFLRKIVKNVGDNVYIAKNVTIIHPENISLGNNVSIHQWCYLDCSGGLEIGNDVSIAHACSIMTFNHTYTDPIVPIRNQPLEYSPVIIKDNVWLGCRVTILPGVVIKSRTVIGAGAVVNKSFENENLIVGGVPAKVLKNI